MSLQHELNGQNALVLKFAFVKLVVYLNFNRKRKHVHVLSVVMLDVAGWYCSPGQVVGDDLQPLLGVYQFVL